MAENNSFELALASASKLPMVKINRKEFLAKALNKACTPEQIEIALAHNPAYAGIDIKTIDKIARASIAYETNKATIISAAAGLPGGYAMIASIPADTTQYFAHLIRILQKLAYLYGWADLVEEDGFDDETTNLLTIFLGVMFGVSGASGVLIKLSNKLAESTYKNLINKALTKTFYYNTIKKIAQQIGIKLTKESFAKSVSKAIPILGAATSGGLTYVTFKPMAKRLQIHLSELKFCDVDYYNNLKTNEEQI